jgi:hypothetical protein
MKQYFEKKWAYGSIVNSILKQIQITNNVDCDNVITIHLYLGQRSMIKYKKK